MKNKNLKIEFGQDSKKFLLELARNSVSHFLETGEIPEIEADEIPTEFKKDGAVFVTLTLNDELRGCIGHLEAIQPIWRDVAENAISSAFGDPRFSPLTKPELEKIRIEISLLAAPARLEYRNAEQLIDFLKREKPGLIIKKGARQATFLPSVWEGLSEAEEFLSHLCLKAGLSSFEWQKGDLEVRFYKAEKISEA